MPSRDSIQAPEPIESGSDNSPEGSDGQAMSSDGKEMGFRAWIQPSISSCQSTEPWEQSSEGSLLGSATSRLGFQA